jgi:hypothetical protein
VAGEIDITEADLITVPQDPDAPVIGKLQLRAADDLERIAGRRLCGDSSSGWSEQLPAWMRRAGSWC